MAPALPHGTKSLFQRLHDDGGLADGRCPKTVAQAGADGRQFVQPRGPVHADVDELLGRVGLKRKRVKTGKTTRNSITMMKFDQPAPPVKTSIVSRTGTGFSGTISGSTAR